MFKNLMLFLGLRSAQRGLFGRRAASFGLPAGGLLPLAYLAWTNRDKIRAGYQQIRGAIAGRTRGSTAELHAVTHA